VINPRDARAKRPMSNYDDAMKLKYEVLTLGHLIKIY
jgi:hypothetical protein